MQFLQPGHLILEFHAGVGLLLQRIVQLFIGQYGLDIQLVPFEEALGGQYPLTLLELLLELFVLVPYNLALLFELATLFNSPVGLPFAHLPGLFDLIDLLLQGQGLRFLLLELRFGEFFSDFGFVDLSFGLEFGLFDGKG